MNRTVDGWARRRHESLGLDLSQHGEAAHDLGLTASTVTTSTTTDLELTSPVRAAPATC